MDEIDKVRYMKVTLMNNVFRITLPKKMARELGIQASDYIKVVYDEKHKRLIITKVEED